MLDGQRLISMCLQTKTFFIFYNIADFSQAAMLQGEIEMTINLCLDLN